MPRPTDPVKRVCYADDLTVWASGVHIPDLEVSLNIYLEELTTYLKKSNLLNVFDDMLHMLDIDSSVDMVYLDFSKAFDKIDHGILLHNLRNLGITGKLGVWLFQFLTNVFIPLCEITWMYWSG